MKLISLNSWGGRITRPLFDYIKQNTDSVDVFCFQEVLKGGIGKTSRYELKSVYEDISKILVNYTGYFFEYGEGGYYSESIKGLGFEYGIACFVKKNLKQSFGGGVTLYDLEKKWNDYSGKFAAGASFVVLVEDYVITNVHGLWQGGIKKDTEAKIEQSKHIIDLAKMFEGKKIICGDFNLLPDTKAIQMLRDGYTDLIQKYNIKDTRGSLYTKELRYSDYMFSDKGIVVRNFAVPNTSVSDHLPLVIEFDI